MKQSLATGDVVVLEDGRRGRVVATREEEIHVLLSTTTVACAPREARRINSWWNTEEMRAAFSSEGRQKRRAHRARGAVTKVRGDRQGGTHELSTL